MLGLSCAQFKPDALHLWIRDPFKGALKKYGNLEPSSFLTLSLILHSCCQKNRRGNLGQQTRRCNLRAEDVPRSNSANLGRGQVQGKTARLRSIQDRVHHIYWSKDGAGGSDRKHVLLG